MKIPNSYRATILILSHCGYPLLFVEEDYLTCAQQYGWIIAISNESCSGYLQALSHMGHLFLLVNSNKKNLLKDQVGLTTLDLTSFIQICYLIFCNIYLTIFGPIMDMLFISITMAVCSQLPKFLCCDLMDVFYSLLLLLFSLCLHCQCVYTDSALRVVDTFINLSPFG